MVFSGLFGGSVFVFPCPMSDLSEVMGQAGVLLNGRQAQALWHAHSVSTLVCLQRLERKQPTEKKGYTKYLCDFFCFSF